MIVQDGGAPPRSATGTIYVTVLDEYDNAPAFLHVGSGQELPVQVGVQAGAPMRQGPDGFCMWGQVVLLGRRGWVGGPRRVLEWEMSRHESDPCSSQDSLVNLRFRGMGMSLGSAGIPVHRAGRASGGLWHNQDWPAGRSSWLTCPCREAQQKEP